MAHRFIQEGCKVVAVNRCQDKLDAFVHVHGPAKAAGVKFDICDHEDLDSFVTKSVHQAFSSHSTPSTLINVHSQSDERTPRPRLRLPKGRDATSRRFDRPHKTRRAPLPFRGCGQSQQYRRLDDEVLALLAAEDYRDESDLVLQMKPSAENSQGSHIAIIPAESLPAYSASNAALNSFVLSLRLQLQDSSVKVVEISPPVVKSTEPHLTLPQ
ncbi:MAG: hypothetical protein Q9201_001774 [Fulgogasparrea decipioides]